MMFERPKTSHGRRASTGSAVYHEAKPVRREYQYPDRIEQVQWEDTGGVPGEGQLQENSESGDQRVEFHHQSSRDHRRDSGGYPLEGFERPASRRGYPRQGRPFVDTGLDSPRCASFDDESYPPSSQPVIVQEPKRKTRPKSARRHSTHSTHKTQVFDIPILRPPSSLTRFQPLPSIGSKPEHGPGEMDRLVLHADKMQLEDDEQTMDSLSRHATKLETKSAHHERKPKSKYRESVNSEHKSHSKHSFEHSEDPDFSSRQTENHSFHQDSDNDGFMRKGDVRHDKKWSKHTEQSHTEQAHPSRELSSTGEDGKPTSERTKVEARRFALSPEPTDSETRLLLAVKSPGDGQRFTRYFRPSSTLGQVIRFAEDVSGLDLSSYSIACNAPRRVFSDFNQTCEGVGLQDRTMLYFELRNM